MCPFRRPQDLGPRRKARPLEGVRGCAGAGRLVAEDFDKWVDPAKMVSGG